MAVSTNGRNRPHPDGGEARPGRDERRDQQRAHRRAQLLDAAIGEIRLIGPGATMAQLAKAGGVTKPILYRHFGDRDGLIAAIAEHFSVGLLRSVEEPLLSSDDPRLLLESTIEGYVAYLEGDPFLYRFLIQQSSGPAESGSSISSLVDVVARQIAQISTEQLRAAGRDAGGAVPWAYGIVGLVHTATNWWLDAQTMSRERFVGYLTELLWQGLAAAGAPAAVAART